jgi:hypothetical protein
MARLGGMPFVLVAVFLFLTRSCLTRLSRIIELLYRRHGCLNSLSQYFTAFFSTKIIKNSSEVWNAFLVP